MLNYPFSTPVNGIDVSKYQGTIDWPKVKAAGYNFVFVRIGYSNWDGSIVLDPYFNRNMEGAIAAGMNVGTYLYSYIDSEDHARIAATKVLELVDEYKLSMPIVLDYEHGATYSNFSKDKNTGICNAFMKVIANAGHLPMYYSYTAFCNSYMNMAALEKYEGLWIANYTGKIGIDDAAVWQYSSNGRVDGIPGRVDMNRMYCDLPRLVNEKYNPNANVEFNAMTDKLLDVFDEKRCEYFSKPSIYAIVDAGNGISAKLPNGQYEIVGIADRLVDGFQMVEVKYESKNVYVAVLDDRCRIIDDKTKEFKIKITPVPNAGDRYNIRKYLESLGFKMEIL